MERSKYVFIQGDRVYLQIQNQGFCVYTWDKDPEEDARQWYADMLTIAINNLIEMETQKYKDVIASDDKRLAEAAEKVWGEHVWGCDAPDKMADAILGLRAQLKKLTGLNEAVKIEEKDLPTARDIRGLWKKEEDK
jgi:hypothetical protein